MSIETQSFQDKYGRPFNTLRVSLTDRCDLRCRYCMPAQGATFAPRPDLLSTEEFRRALWIFYGLGMRRFKFTGGEPLLRLDLEELISEFSSSAQLGLTTNGTLLAGRAEGLWKAGLRRVTVSCDTLHPGHFAGITRGGDLRRVLDGIKACQRLGFSPLKINAVILDQPMEELLQLAALSVTAPLEMRFIEYMPVSFVLKEQQPNCGPRELRDSVEKAFGPLEALGREIPSAPASRWRIRGAQGSLGFISSVSEPFCGACDRLRLQADGFIRLCMARPDGLDFRGMMRGGMDDEEIIRHIRVAAWEKPSGHAFYTENAAQGSQMSSIGG